MKNQVKKYGSENVYVLTARPAESAGPIQQFLKDQGVNIPLKNITGLGNSTGDAKAAWFLDRYAGLQRHVFCRRCVVKRRSC